MANRSSGDGITDHHTRLSSVRDRPSFPLWLKLVYTAFLLVLVPYYWASYGAQNFLYFCDIALGLTLIALWRDAPLPTSMAAIGIVGPQLLWLVDFSYRALTGGHIVDLTEYMFDPGIPLFVRGLSLFHGWLPLLLIYMVVHVGYDRRALVMQTLLTWGVLIITSLTVTDPTHPAGNVNKIFGFVADGDVQTDYSPHAWLGILLVAYPLVILVPSHMALRLLVAASETGEKPEPATTMSHPVTAGGPETSDA
ncbi:MAG: hypothetical protein R3B90_08735 [Planctomycetaceae bacterium]